MGFDSDHDILTLKWEVVEDVSIYAWTDAVGIQTVEAVAAYPMHICFLTRGWNNIVGARHICDLHNAWLDAQKVTRLQTVDKL